MEIAVPWYVLESETEATYDNIWLLNTRDQIATLVNPWGLNK